MQRHQGLEDYLNIRSWRVFLTSWSIDGNSTLKDFENLQAGINDNCADNCLMPELLFKADKHGDSLLYHIFLKGNQGFLAQILRIYSPFFSQLAPQQWRCMLRVMDNECHEEVKKFYGRQYYYKIVNTSDPAIMPLCSRDRIEQYWLEGSLEPLLSDLNHLRFIRCNRDAQGYDQLFYILFLERHGSKVKNAVTHALNSVHPTLEWEVFMAFELDKHKTHYHELNLLKKEEVAFCLKNFGHQKTSTLVGQLLQIADHIYTNEINNDYKTTADSQQIMNFLDCGLSLGENSVYLRHYLHANTDALLYAAATQAITTQEMMAMMRDYKTRTRALHKVVQNKCPEKPLGRERGKL